jgi:mRNA-degrading endonuclease toxin of MazEF toxin-antitoxin module
MNRGDVVEVNWPYSDLSGPKIRPAVVVQADFLNGLIWVANRTRVPGSGFQILTSRGLPELRQTEPPIQHGVDAAA